MNKALLLAVVLPVSIDALPQIPNPSFEDWTTFGTYDDPDGYVSWNGLTAPYGILVCTEGTPGHTGTSYIAITSQHVLALGTNVPGIATTADPITGVEGFPYTQRPGQMTGWWQYQSNGLDGAMVLVEFTKWNSVTQERDDIGIGILNTVGDITSWTSFAVPIFYSSPDDPDTATIILTSSGSGIPQSGSALFVDDLAFDTSTGIARSGLSSDVLAVTIVADQLVVNSSAPMTQLQIIGMDGREVLSSSLSAGNLPVDISALPCGYYIAWASAADGTRQAARFVKR